jgi:NAD(P)-dependent dehydrogenase (short-subunit alcohol dehydrogenase family)
LAVLIFGATGGVGSALARRLVEQGTAVHLSGRDEDKLRLLGEELSCPTSLADIVEPGGIERVAAEAGSVIEGLVYAAGTVTLKPVGRTTDVDMMRDFEVNALGAARAIRSALPALKRAEAASIVVYSTVAAGCGFAFHSSIAMAKGAVEALTRSLAAELAPRIRVNCIAPSLTRTPLTASLVATEQAEATMARAHPLQRIGEVADIVALTEFLLSRQSSWITGQVLAVDGGRSTLSGPV